MKEVTGLRQIPGEPRRRWFASPDFDLIVWVGAEGSFTGFQFCYDKQQQERSIVWTDEHGFRHMSVDGGEQKPGRLAIPLLIADGPWDLRRIHAYLVEIGRTLPPEVASYVLGVVEQFRDFPPPGEKN